MARTGTLYLVATPIGNLQDISLRALEILKSVDLIACEDTRHTRKLLNYFEIQTKTTSYHSHNEAERAEQLTRILTEGRPIAVVSDAGTPAISDPGFLIVQRAIEAGIPVVPIPGPAAFVSALIVSGLPTDAFLFSGFLPARKGERIRRLRELAKVPATLIFYETPHRIAGALADCLEVLGNRHAAVVRELTKIHEETVRGTLAGLISHFATAKTRGEIVICIDRSNENDTGPTPSLTLVERVRELEKAGIDRKTALKSAAKEFGLARSEAYRIVEAEKKL